MAILKLRDEGKLSLDDKASKYIPELKNQGLTTDAAPITIRDLLTHAAGFPEDNPWGDRQLEKTSQEFLAFIKKGIHFSTATGLSYEYSNVGFACSGWTQCKHQVVFEGCFDQLALVGRLRLDD